jgi:hypothetical protein
MSLMNVAFGTRWREEEATLRDCLVSIKRLVVVAHVRFMTILMTVSWRFLVILASERTMCNRSRKEQGDTQRRRGVSWSTSDQIGMHRDDNRSKRSVVSWHNYRSSTHCDQEPRSGGDDFIRQ